MRKRFDGDGFDKSPIEGDEASRFRHMFHEVEKNWGVVLDTATVGRAISIVSSVIKIGLPVATAMLATGIFLASQGWVG